MFDHVGLRVADFAVSDRFYATVLPTLGIERRANDGFAAYGELVIFGASDEHPPTRRLHVGVAAPSREAVDAFWRAGTDAGFASDGDPGERPYTPGYYGAFLLDPAGNSVEAVHFEGTREAGRIDHLWLRVADVAASARFYGSLASAAGFHPEVESAERVSFESADNGSISFVAGDEPTERAHIAFPTHENAAVDAFHAAATSAGGSDNGGPGERPYHPGYYAAFVFDPDGNNIEVVNHNRD